MNYNIGWNNSGKQDYKKRRKEDIYRTKHEIHQTPPFPPRNISLRSTWLVQMQLGEVSEEGRVQNIPDWNPAPLYMSIALPVLWRIGGKKLRWKGQGTEANELVSGDMEFGMDMEGSR